MRRGFFTHFIIGISCLLITSAVAASVTPWTTCNVNPSQIVRFEAVQLTSGNDAVLLQTESQGIWLAVGGSSDNVNCQKVNISNNFNRIWTDQNIKLAAFEKKSAAPSGARLWVFGKDERSWQVAGVGVNSSGETTDNWQVPDLPVVIPEVDQSILLKPDYQWLWGSFGVDGRIVLSKFNVYYTQWHLGSQEFLASSPHAAELSDILVGSCYGCNNFTPSSNPLPNKAIVSESPYVSPPYKMTALQGLGNGKAFAVGEAVFPYWNNSVGGWNFRSASYWIQGFEGLPAPNVPNPMVPNYDPPSYEIEGNQVAIGTLFNTADQHAGFEISSGAVSSSGVIIDYQRGADELQAGVVTYKSQYTTGADNGTYINTATVNEASQSLTIPNGGTINAVASGDKYAVVAATNGLYLVVASSGGIIDLDPLPGVASGTDYKDIALALSGKDKAPTTLFTYKNEGDGVKIYEESLASQVILSPHNELEHCLADGFVCQPVSGVPPHIPDSINLNTPNNTVYMLGSGANTLIGCHLELNGSAVRSCSSIKIKTDVNGGGQLTTAGLPALADNKWLYVPIPAKPAVRVYSINSGGQLVTPPSVAVSSESGVGLFNPTSVVYDSGYQNIYIANGTGTIISCHVDNTNGSVSACSASAPITYGSNIHIYPDRLELSGDNSIMLIQNSGSGSTATVVQCKLENNNKVVEIPCELAG